MKTLFRIAVAAWFLTAMFVALPGGAQPLVAGTVQVTDAVLKPSGNHKIDRTYLVWDGRANCAGGAVAPLVLALHGGTGSASGMAAQFAPQGCAVVAYPAGSDKRGGTIFVSGDNLSWNGYAVPEQGWSGLNGVDENQFLLALVAKLKAQFGTGKTFGVGLSKGGMLVHHAACDLAAFDAIATVAATIADPTCTPALHVPLLHVHGLADVRVCWVFTGSGCNPWPVAEPKINFWLSMGGAHQVSLIHGEPHGWPTGTTAQIWTWLGAR